MRLYDIGAFCAAMVERRLSMKKILCLVLALLCLSAYAMAESVPSKNTSDMVSVEIDATSNPDLPVDSGLVVLPVLEDGRVVLVRQYRRRKLQSWRKTLRRVKKARKLPVWKRISAKCTTARAMSLCSARRLPRRLWMCLNSCRLSWKITKIPMAM